MALATEAEIEEQKYINEEYKVWKKNSLVLYNSIYTRALEWPTLTTQWFPDSRQVPGRPLKEHRLLLGTNTSGKDKESIIIARVNMPTRSETDPRDYNVDLGEVGGYGSTVDVFKWEIIQTMQHPGEVNKARYMPQNPEIIASMVGSGSDDVKSGTVLIFDRTKHPLKPTSFNPQMQLVGHTQEGYGLSWNPKQEGILASASNDKTVRLWNIKDGFSKKNANNHPSERTLTHHTAPVNDVEFHPRDPNILASVSDDRTLQIIDLRGNKPAMKIQAHADSVNCLNWHPDASFNHVILTGSSDNSIGLWDPRRGQKGKLHSFESHNDDVIRVEWNPHCISMFASASYDRRVCIWDVSKIGGEQEQQDSEDAPPEMIFMHGGLTNRVCDLNWNPNEPNLLVAAAEDNQVQAFIVSDKLMFPGMEGQEEPEASMEDVDA